MTTSSKMEPWPQFQQNLKLRDIIKERKAEKRLETKQKLQMDLQRIRDMNSTTGIDPLQRFPKEIWVKIFEELNPEDRHNFWQIHPLFRDLMEKSRIQDILFPMVFKLDKFLYWVDHYPIQDNADNDDNNDDDEEFKHEQLRCICKTMRNAYDRWRGDNLMKTMHGLEFPFQPSVVINLGVNNIHKLNKKLALLNDGKRIHIFHRGLNVRILDFYEEGNDWELISQFTKKVTTLLENIGDQIWYFSFSIDDLRTAEYSFPQVYTLFRGWISLMPNLKWMEINVDCFSPPRLSQNKKISIAQETIRNHPFPRLASLEKITLHLCHDHKKKELYEMYSAVLETNQRVQILDFEYDIQPHLNFLPNQLIKSLHLTYLFFRCTRLRLAGLLSFVNFSWNLNSITLKLDKSTGISMHSLFRFLERFPTLENVSLRLPNGFKIGDRKWDTLRDLHLLLPNLTNFKIRLIEPKIDYDYAIYLFFSLQFLLQCKKLKTLKWTIRDFDDVKLRSYMVNLEYTKDIDFRAGLRFLYDSNIWDVFPYLETVQVDFMKENANESEKCAQKYLRKVRGDGFSVSDFLRNHGCCEENRLRDCAILFG